MKTNTIRFIAAAVIALTSTGVQAVESQFAASVYHTVFVDNGNVYAMGTNGFRQTNPQTTAAMPALVTVYGDDTRTPTFTGVQNVRTVAAGYATTAAIKNDGSLVVWGWLANVGGVQKWTKPINPVPGTVVTDVAVSNLNVYFIVNGVVYRWDRINMAVAISSAADGQAVSVAAGDNHAVVLFADGTVGTTGSTNTVGQLGQAGVVSSDKVAKLFAISGAMEIVAQQDTTLVRTRTGEVWGFGRNASAQLGLGHINNVMVPTMLPYVGAIKKMTLKRSSAVFQMEDNSIKAAGSHNYISGAVYNTSKVFTTLPGLTNITNVYSGGQVTFVKYSVANQICGWGGNANGMLGDNTNVERHAPVCVSYTPVAAPVVTPVAAPAPTPVVVAPAPVVVPAPVAPAPVVAPVTTSPFAPVVAAPVAVAPAPVVAAPVVTPTAPAAGSGTCGSIYGKTQSVNNGADCKSQGNHNGDKKK